MKHTKSLLLGAALTFAACAPVAASAHTDLFFGLNLGGLFGPPAVVYAPPAYYAPAPPVYYAPAPVYVAPPPVYYAPRPIYRAPTVIYYGHRGWDHDGWNYGDRGRHWDHGDHRHHDDD